MSLDVVAKLDLWRQESFASGHHRAAVAICNLVAEQQEDVWEIHDLAATTKENMENGQENLHETKERQPAATTWRRVSLPWHVCFCS